MKKFFFALMAFTMLSGCASIVKGRHKNLNLMTSTGEEALVNVVSASGMRTATVPSVITVKRNNQDIIIAVQETPCTRSTIAPSRIEPWFLGNFISGGLLASSTDALTGAMWTYDDNIVVPVYKKPTCHIQ